MKINSRLMAIFLAVISVVSTVNAQKSLKPWSEWSEKEAQKLLNNSPWAKTLSLSGMINRSAPLGPYDLRYEDLNDLRSLLSANFQVRFLSAQPIRQAVARIVGLKQKTPDPELSKQLQSFVDRKFEQWIVIAVDYDLSNGRDASPLRQAFASANLKTLRNSTYLENKQGQRLLLQDYKAPSNDGLGAKFIFPRLVNGQPFITTDMKEVRFYVEVTKFLTLNTSFKVSEMMYHGSLEY